MTNSPWFHTPLREKPALENTAYFKGILPHGPQLIGLGMNIWLIQMVHICSDVRNWDTSWLFCFLFLFIGLPRISIPFFDLRNLPPYKMWQEALNPFPYRAGKCLILVLPGPFAAKELMYHLALTHRKYLLWTMSWKLQRHSCKDTKESCFKETRMGSIGSIWIQWPSFSGLSQVLSRLSTSQV